MRYTYGQAYSGVRIMAAISYEYVLELAKQLTPVEQRALIEQLRARQSGHVTREMLLAEFERRKAAGAAEHDTLYFGKYANPAVDVNAEAIEATLHEAATEWEKELDEFFGKD
jgi:hypothetical protein